MVNTIENIFIDMFGDKIFEPLKPAFDLLHFVIFNIVEKFDYVWLTRILTEFLKKCMKVDMNIVEILMMYFLLDNYIAPNTK